MIEDLVLDNVVDFARPALADFIKKRSVARILIVVDTEISLAPGVTFGIERVIRLLRESTVGCMRFTVDVGLRSAVPFSIVAAPTGANAKYLGFRFDSTLPNSTKVIDNYDEVWCYGFKPDNSDGPDTSITLPNALPTSDPELAVLTAWMNKKGGVFATGDHDYLGASMCHRIPRISTMRAWTNAQGVPPIGGPLRIDTHRPLTAAEIDGTAIIGGERQSDELPQQIDWVPWLSVPSFQRPIRRRPHPVLCHPTLGPINVMPDHAHEGVVFDHVPQPSVGLAAITLTNKYDFGAGVAGREYPALGAIQPLPMVIAYGRTLADPPLMHVKGDSPAKRFAMISVYDGHRANVGRVATDSTWHHWMNLNIAQIEAAGGDNWEKIKRYYLNLAVWLAPPHIQRNCFHIHLLTSFYSYPGIEEFNPKADILELGFTFQSFLLKWYGPCWITQFVFDFIGQIDIKLCERLIEKYLTIPLPKRPLPPLPTPCLTCPPPEMLEAAILGGIVRSVAELVQDGGIEASVKKLSTLSSEELDKQLLGGAAVGLETIRTMYAGSMEQTRQLLG
jgi:hypothetical protein